MYADADVREAIEETAPEEKKVEPKVLHGVPVEAWVLSKRNKVNLNKVPPPAPGNLRVFVQCMELKKGETDELTERKCRELAQRGQRERPQRF